MSNDVRTTLGDVLPYPLLKAEIPDRTAIAECMALQHTLFDATDSPTKALARLYENLFKESSLDGTKKEV